MKRKRRRESTPNDIDRRSFIATAAITSAATAFAPSVLSPAGAQASVQWKPAPCRLCGVGCGLLVGIQGGRAVAVKGDPGHPVSQGMACVKGYYAIQAMYARDRITRAMVRRDGVLAPTSMTDALNLVAARVRDSVQRHGPDSVALYGSAQWSAVDALIAARLFRGAIGTRNVDTSARLHSAAADYGALTTYGQSGPPGNYEDIDHADVFVLWDVNMAETDPVLFSRMLERRRVNPAARIIDLATRSTRTSYAADRALLYAPQSALAIANAICQEIVARRQANRDFVNRHVAFKRSRLNGETGSNGDVLATDNEADADWNAFVAFLNDYQPERAQTISGLAAAEIRWLASLYADPARRVVSMWGANVNRQHNGLWLNNALHNIHLLVGKVASPGNAALPVSTQPGGAALLDDVMAHRPISDDARTRFGALWGTDAARIDTRQARPALSIFRALERGEIRVLWIQATNPMVSLPDLVRFRAAARRGAFIVVSDAFPTPTTDVADVVLPAAIWIEREAITVNGERRIQMHDRLVAPPGDSMSDARQLIEVGRRLGHEGRFPWNAARLLESTWPAIADAQEATALPDLTLLEQGGALWPARDDRQTLWRYNAEHDPAADKSREFDFYGHADHRAWIWLRPWEAAPDAPDREFPFWLTTGSVVEHWGTGTLTRRIPTLHRAVPRSYLEMHRTDARELGIHDRDIVRLTSRRGSVELEARIDHRGQPQRRVLFAPSFDENVALNLLTLDDACPVSGQIRYDTCAVRITRVRSGA